MKKGLLILVLATIVSTKAFAGFGLGAKFYFDANHDIAWGGGITLGMGSMTGNAFIIDLLLGTHGGDFDIKTSFDWHALRWNISIIQLYLGIGVGLGMEFDAHDRGSRDPDPFDFILAGRIPFGLKVFLDRFELFLEITPQLGWVNHSFNSFDAAGNKDRLSSNGFYWAIGGSLGGRFWF
ncbi:MAG: hypothetical protein ACRCVN_03125 [Spirochaetia bacterium]